MRVTTKFTAYSDPAHGWVKVSKKLLKVLGIDTAISTFSYQKGEFAYLEEDGDASLFVRTYEEKYGVVPTITDKYSNGSSKIRTYENYEPLTEVQEIALADLRVRMLNHKSWSPKIVRQINGAGLAMLMYWQTIYKF